MSFKNVRMIIYGFLLGTAGVKALSSKSAKKVYTKATAVALKGIDETMKTAETIKENCEDILAEAKEINAQEEKEEKEEIIEDTSKKTKKRKTSKK